MSDHRETNPREFRRRELNEPSAHRPAEDAVRSLTEGEEVTERPGASPSASDPRLAERLQERADSPPFTRPEWANVREDLREAAAAVRERDEAGVTVKMLMEQVEWLEGQVERRTEERDDADDDRVCWWKRAERLEAALREIADHPEVYGLGTAHYVRAELANESGGGSSDAAQTSSSSPPSWQPSRIRRWRADASGGRGIA